MEVIGISLIFVLSIQILYIMSNNLEIFGKPIEKLKRFTKFGDEFTFIKYNPEKNTYLYKRVNIDTGFICYEVVIPRRMRNPDGSIVYVYPGTEMFGSGHAMCTLSLDRAEEYLNNGCARIER